MSSSSILIRVGHPGEEFTIVNDLRISPRFPGRSTSVRRSILNTVRFSSMKAPQPESGGIDELNASGKLTLQLMLSGLLIYVYCPT